MAQSLYHSVTIHYFNMQTQVISSKRFLQKQLVRFMSDISITGHTTSSWTDQHFALLRENGQILIDDGTIGWGAFMGSVNQFIGSFNGQKLYCCGGAGIITNDGRTPFTAGNQYDLVLLEAPFSPPTLSNAVWTIKQTLATKTIVSGQTLVYAESQLTIDNAIELDADKVYMLTFKNNSGTTGYTRFGVQTTLNLGKGVIS